MLNPRLEALYVQRVAEALEAMEGLHVSDGPAHKAAENRLRSARMKLARARGSHTESEWQALVRECDGNCVRCGRHHAVPDEMPVKGYIVPIAMGGSCSITNVMPICRACAGAKGTECIDWLAAYRADHVTRETMAIQPVKAASAEVNAG